jgi:hypothetical protein
MAERLRASATAAARRRRSAADRPCPGSEGGQASVELVAGIPALILAGLIALQLLAVGYAATLADGAVEAGALALAAGEPPGPAIRRALPGWADGRVEADVSGGHVAVAVRPPALLGPLASGLEVEEAAWVKPDS